MKIIVCIDECRGMLFGGRRQSRDRVLIADMVRHTGEWLLISPFSKILFEGYVVRVSESPLDTAGDGDYVFIENEDALPYLDKIDEIIIYNWNRTYPRDFLFKIEPKSCGFTLAETSELVGSSHEKITKEVYRR